jgi:hypothetical protein
MPQSARILVKLAGTLGVCALIWWSLQRPNQGILREVIAFGPAIASLVAVVFVALVAAYARDLQRLLRAVPAAQRAATPASVWWMFAIPYNFTEDFFIIHNVGASLRRTETATPALRGAFGRFGLISGYGWCALQIGSLVPHPLGTLAGFLALPLWAWHWRFARAARRSLIAHSPASPKD